MGIAAETLQEPDDVEYVMLDWVDWVDWVNHRRLLEPIGRIPPVELGEMFYRGEVPAEEAGLTDRVSHSPGAVQFDNKEREDLS
jgi:hypothetical protein